jgi:large conductance mechanosensitive channel
MLQEFRTFLVRGNVIDLAVALVIGAAFTAVVTSFVNDLLMPPIGRLLGRASFADFVVVRAVNRVTAPQPVAPAPAPTRECPYCTSDLRAGA